MSRMVMCRKYKKEMEGLALAPLPGVKGQALFDSISKQAWGEWMQHQTLIINEKQLNLMDLGDRTYLTEQMNKFFDGEAVDQAEGYVAEDK
jgi:Fe-S cluster biosynthesis and repair protein YggX